MAEWPNGGMTFAKQDIRSPFDFEQMAPARPAGGLPRPDGHLGRPGGAPAQIQRFLDMGSTRLYLHNVGRNQAQWIEVFGREVLPGLHG